MSEELRAEAMALADRYLVRNGDEWAYMPDRRDTAALLRRLVDRCDLEAMERRAAIRTAREAVRQAGKAAELRDKLDALAAALPPSAGGEWFGDVVEEVAHAMHTDANNGQDCWDVEADDMANAWRSSARAALSCPAVLAHIAAREAEARENAERRIEERFWTIVDRDGITGVPSDMWAALDVLVTRAAAAGGEHGR